MQKWNIKGNKEISSIKDMPENTFGFVYIIKNLDKNKSYIGKKQVIYTRKKKFGKRKLAAMTDKRLKDYEMVQSESNWKKYTGSCKELNEDIKNGDKIERIIIDFAFGKQHLTYLELKYQFAFGVIESDDYYNENIQGKFYRKIFEF